MNVRGLRSLLFIGVAVLTGRAVIAAPLEGAPGNPTTFPFASKHIAAEVSLRQPAFRALSVDSLGLGEFAASSLRIPTETETEYSVRRDGNTVEYHKSKAAKTCPACWTFELRDREIRLVSRWLKEERPVPLTSEIDPDICHVTLLGILNEDGSVCLPALVHFPGQGTLRVTAPRIEEVSLVGQTEGGGCDALRHARRNPATRLPGPRAKRNDLRLESLGRDAARIRGFPS